MDNLAFHIIVLAIPTGWFIGWLFSVLGWHFLVENKDKTVIEARIDDETKARYSEANEVNANNEKSLLQQWIDEWDYNIGNVVPTIKDEFIKSYRDAAIKAEKNRKMNFACKGLFWSWLILVMCVQILYLGLIIYQFSLFTSKANALFATSVSNATEKIEMLKIPLEPTIIAAIEAVLLITGVVGALAISKRADIRKYQETWARHARAVELMNIEMIKYINCISPYSDTENNEELFASAMMELRKENIEKFVANLETKEKDLFSDAVNLLKPTGK